ncbi:MAG: hypothetical protein ABID54_05840 [Pseudomonadota bacterium]
MNKLDSSPDTIFHPLSKVPQARSLGQCDALVKGTSDNTRRREKEHQEETEVVSFDFSDGIWQQTTSIDYIRFVEFSDYMQNGKRGSGTEGIREVGTYYDSTGVLVVKEEVKGRFVDGLF